MGRLLLILVPILALLGGAGAGYALRPPPPVEADDAVKAAPEAVAEDAATQLVTFRDSFIVPVMRSDRIWSHVILTLGVEARRLSTDEIYAMEPVLRDGLTEALFLHGAAGDFDGDFTAPIAMNRLRSRLNESVRTLLRDADARVLIVALARQQR
jgi:hypothetical protein